jgi:hypothetical protein
MKTKQYIFMKILLVIIALITMSALGQTNGVYVSKQTNGWCIALQGVNHQTGLVKADAIDINDELVWIPFSGIPSSTNTQRLLYYLDPIYGMRVKMTDSDGNEVEKTSLCKKWGSKFNKLDFSLLTTDNNFKIYSIDDCGLYHPSYCVTGLSGHIITNRPSELFKIKKTGIYTMEIEMQIFKRPPEGMLNNENAWKSNLIQFPPVQIKVKKTKM